jgi:hypothetical protein
MAKVTFENVTVERLIPGYGFKATETTSVKGEERKTWITVWSKDAVVEGQVLSITGELGVKLEEFTGRDGNKRQTAAIHVNNATLSQGADAPF